MSFWTSVRDPLMGMAIGGPIGAAAGLGYDKLSGNGAFEPGPQFQANYAGMPAYPDYTPIYNQDTQSLAPKFKGELNGINPDQSGINAYAQSALRSGPSPWAKMAEAKSYQDQGLQGDTLAKNNASNVATAQGNLAMHGGLRSGAAERLATSGNSNLLSAQQQNAASGLQNRSQIGINDEQNRIAQLGQLPGMQMQQAEFGLKKAGMGEASAATDIQNQMLAAQSQNQFNLGKYNTMGSIWGAGQQANATANSGSSSWVCSAAARKMGIKYSKDETRALKLLAAFSKRARPETAGFYFEQCHQLVEKMEKAFVDWKDVHAFVKKIAFQIIAGDLEGAASQYELFVRKLISHFWPECAYPTYMEV